MNEDFIVNCVTDYCTGSTQAVRLDRVQHDLAGPVFCSEPTPGETYQEKLRDQLVSSYQRLYPPMIATQYDNQRVLVDLKSSYLRGVSVTAWTDVLEVDESEGSNVQPPERVDESEGSNVQPPERVGESVGSNVQLPERIVDESVDRRRVVSNDEASGGTSSCDADTNTEQLAFIPNGVVKESKQPSRNDSGLGPSVQNSSTSTSAPTMADQSGASASLDSGLSEGAYGRQNGGQGNQTSPETNRGSIIGWMRKRSS